MPQYTYTATDRAGKTVEGVVVADNSALAVGKVREMGYHPEKVRVLEAERASAGQILKENFLYPVVSGVPLKDLVVFYRQFATLIDAGLPLYQALHTLENQSRNAKLKEILRDCQSQVQAGGRLSDVFAAHRWVFSELQIEMIRSAEHGGMLDDMLLRIADYLEQELNLRRLISRLTLYPKIVLVSALFILGRSFFSDFMPAFSKLIVGSVLGRGGYGLWEYLMDTVFFLIFVGAVVFGIVAVCRVTLFQSPKARESYEQLKMAIPGIGPAVRAFALAKFGRAFGAMYAGGLPIHAAIRIAGNASGNATIANATGRAMEAVERGAPVSQAFRETGVFPPLVIDMLHTGEQTGNMDAMMRKAAEYLEDEASSRAHLNAHIFATAIYLLVALLVAYAIISFYASGGSSSAGAMLGGSME